MFDNFTTDKTEWKPHLRQEQAIIVPDTVLEKFYGGAAGGGKTDLGICYPLVKKCKKTNRLWYQHPQFKGLIIRRTIPELKKELTKRCYQYYPQTGAKYNKSDRVWTWPWGAQMFLSAAEHEDDVRKYDTEQFNYIFFEELTSFLEFQYIFMLSRCRPADEDLPSCVFSASNPGNVGHGWVRKRFVEPAREGNKILRQYFYDDDGNKKLEENPLSENFGKPKYIQRIFIKALGSDNPHLLKNDPDYLTKLEALPEAEKAAKLYGDWWTFSGQVFDSFRTKRFPDEPKNALHCIPSFVIPSWWPRVLAIDWGYKAATVCYWAAISPEGRVYIYREYYVTQTDVVVWGTETGELSRGENLKVIVLDTNAWDSRGEEKTIAKQFEDAFVAVYGKLDYFSEAEGKTITSVAIEKASKARISGKILCQEYLRWKQKPILKDKGKPIYDEEQAERLKRLSPIAFSRYVELFKPPQLEKNIPRLQIFEEECPKLIECIPLCVYDDKVVEDVKEWQQTENQVGDDPYDCLRYLLKRTDKYVHESKLEFEDRAKVDKVVEGLQVTGDQTSYYRRMEKLESDKISSKGPIKHVSRFRKRFSSRVH